VKPIGLQIVLFNSFSTPHEMLIFFSLTGNHQPPFVAVSAIYILNNVPGMSKDVQSQRDAQVFF